MKEYLKLLNPIHVGYKMAETRGKKRNEFLGYAATMTGQFFGYTMLGATIVYYGLEIINGDISESAQGTSTILAGFGSGLLTLNLNGRGQNTYNEEDRERFLESIRNKPLPTLPSRPSKASKR